MEETAGSGKRLSDLLTIVIQTRDHPDRVLSLLRMFEACGIDCRIVVADSRDAAFALRSRVAAWRHGATFRSFEPETSLFDKLSAVLAEIETPFVFVTPDRKIDLPHAIKATLDHLVRHEDHAAAIGYVIGINQRAGDVEFSRVALFTPTVGEDDPLQRHYHLMRRYQPALWAAFRKSALVKAAEAARTLEGFVFQEIMFMNALVLQGKLARLRMIGRLEGPEQSMTSMTESDPLHWLLHDARSFMERTVAYRRALTRFVAANDIPVPAGTELDRLLDAIHAVWLRRSLDDGQLNYATRVLLGDPIPPLLAVRERQGWRPVEDGDVVHPGKGGRRYIWRREVLTAEPSHEIELAPADMDQTERELDCYFEGRR